MTIIVSTSSLASWLVKYSEAHLSSCSEALVYSTISSAYSLNLFDRERIDKGLKADLIIWDLENINQLGYYWGYNRAYRIIKEGKILNF